MGRGASVIVSTTRVTMAGFPIMLHWARIPFWVRNIFSAGTSIPRFPRETMQP